jgi:hypothetical protein
MLVSTVPEVLEGGRVQVVIAGADREGRGRDVDFARLDELVAVEVGPRIADRSPARTGL